MTKLRKGNGPLLILLVIATVFTIVATIALVSSRFSEDRIPRQAAPPNKGYTNENLQGIALRNTEVRPGRLYVQLGNTVIFNNNDSVTHRVKTVPGSPEQFDSGPIPLERTFDFKPKKLTGDGEPIKFVSTDDPELMQGEIIVIKGEPPLSGSDGAVGDTGAGGSGSGGPGSP